MCDPSKLFGDMHPKGCCAELALGEIGENVAQTASDAAHLHRHAELSEAS